MPDAQLQRTARGHFLQVDQIEAVVLLDLIVIRFLAEGQREHALFLQIRFVYAGERLHQNGPNTEVPRLHGRVFARAAFSIVVVAHHQTADPLFLVCPLGVGYTAQFAGQLILDRIGLLIEKVHRSGQGVVGNVVQMTAEAQPGPCHGNMIGGALAFGLDQKDEIVEVVSVPGGKGFEQLQPLRSAVLDRFFQMLPMDVAFFGEKDFQQLAVVRKLVELKGYELAVRGCPTMREKCGLAMSSRNTRLSLQGRQRACMIHQGLLDIKEQTTDLFEAELVAQTIKKWTALGIDVEYLELANDSTFQAAQPGAPLLLEDPWRLFAAVHLDGVRLIDNLALKS